MKTWKRNAIIAAAVMLVCGGVYLNWQYGGTAKLPLEQTLNEEKILDEQAMVIATQEDSLAALAEANAPSVSAAEYFAQMRLSRQQSRDGAVELLQETIAYAGENENIAESSRALNRIVDFALSEAQIESLVISKGYSDCVAYMTEEGISLAVPAAPEGLSEADVALLTDIVMGQSDYALQQIRIIEVNN